MKEQFSDPEIVDSVAQSAPQPIHPQPIHKVTPEHQPDSLPSKSPRRRMMIMILTASSLACLWILLFASPAKG